MSNVLVNGDNLCPTLHVSLDCPFLIATSLIFIYAELTSDFYCKTKKNILREKAKDLIFVHGILNYYRVIEQFVLLNL
jgi:hypothetical protein